MFPAFHNFGKLRISEVLWKQRGKLDRVGWSNFISFRYIVQKGFYTLETFTDC